MPPFVSLLVKLSREFSVEFRGDDRDDVPRQEVVAQPIGIKGAICQQVSGGQTFKQRPGLAKIMGLPRHQAEIDEVAEGIGQGKYLGGYPAARTSNGLAKSPPFAPCPER